MSLVWELDLPQSDKMVLLVIADHASDDGTNAYPSVGTIARKSSMSERTVQRSLVRLEQLRLVSISRQTGGPSYIDPSRKPNAYTINGATISHLLDSRDDKVSPLPPSPSHPSPVTMSPKPSIEPSLEPSVIKKNVPTKYEAIWEACEELANYLADKIEKNGSKRPTVTQEWIMTVCRMIDIDHRTYDQVRGAIDWCQADSFWSANILSPQSLRKQYDRLRLQATKQRSNKGISAVKDYLSEVMR